MRGPLIAALLLAAAAPVPAQPGPPVPTRIEPDTAPGRSLGTTVDRTGLVYTIDGGRLSGSNLFHSFSHFDLGLGDTARWTHGGGDAAHIANVVSRVTGGDPSHLFGTLDSSSLPNADFYFINPAGIVFGAGAQLNVPAAAHFSTASAIGFKDGGIFTVATPSGSTLSMASPEAFGFFGNEAAMLLDGVEAFPLGASSKLSLSAADIEVRNSTITGGGFQLFAAGRAPASLRIGLPSPGTGAIAFTGSLVETVSSEGVPGAITLSGGAVSLDDSALVARSSAAAPSGAILISADSLALDNGSSIATVGIEGTSAGDIYGFATRIGIRGGSFVGSQSEGRGAPGSIALMGEEIALSGGRVVSETFGEGDAGVVLLAGTSSVTMENLSSVSTDSGASGRSGAVSVRTARLSLTDSVISSDALGEGEAGGVVVEAGEADLVRSYVTSDSYGAGAGGAVYFDVPGTLTLRDGSSLSSNAFASGDSGGVLVSGGNLLLEASGLAANALGEGDALFIGIQLSGALTLGDGAEISSDSSGKGSAGGIIVEARRIALNASRIGSEAFGDGDGGLVSLTASGLVSLEEEAVVASDTYGEGDAGGIVIAAGDVAVSGESRVSSDARGDGQGGGIEITATNSIELARGFVSADVQGAGNGGDVTVTAKSIEMRSGSFITADGYFTATGNGGDVSVRADSLSMRTLSSITSEARGEGNGGNVALDIGRLTMTDRANITSRTLGAGDAGQIRITGGSAEITDSWIDSDAFGAGGAGSVTLELGGLTLANSRISSEAAGSGDSGVIDLAVSGALTLRGSEVATNTFGSGTAGGVSVNAASIRMTEGSAISSAAVEGAGGPSGNVEVRTADLEVVDGSRITTSLSNPNAAGNIDIDAARLLLSGNGSAISSENASAAGGPAGSIFIRTNGATVSEGGRVTTNSANGAAGNILFDMPASAFLFLTGISQPGVLETSSGPGTGGLIIIASPKAIVSHGGSILALGESGGANVLISTNYFIPSADRLNRVEVDGELAFENAIYDVSAGTVSPDLTPIDASGILRGQCPAIRSGGSLSQLTVRPTGPYGNPSPAAVGDRGQPRPETCR